ncbi:DUF6894 family protein [Methylobacterium iners]|uniref:DUF6894 domain-containing protein n=1 Tax=Methylobacterium iners TaxID=418707 RepID=A0ABQ4S3W6_9HYPH|nr:hypothetical protein [Methylobacterium iners]GJD97102.1 hypothetical protein OCOJLMKI_4330 [Methylobacterium iners]
MSQRFYFDLEKGLQTIRDYKGVDARDRYEAINEATAVLEKMRKIGVLPRNEEGWLLSIKDTSRVTLIRLPVMPCVLATA